MKQTHHIGYVQTPSVKNLSNVKNALVENGLVPLTTPNEMLPDAIEKGVTDLKSQIPEKWETMDLSKKEKIKRWDNDFEYIYFHSNDIDAYGSYSSSSKKGIYHLNLLTGETTLIYSESYSWSYFFEASNGIVYVGSQRTGTGIVKILGTTAEQIYTSALWSYYFEASNGDIYVGSPSNAGIVKISGNTTEQIYASDVSWRYFFETSRGDIYVGSSSSNTGILHITETTATKIYTTGKNWNSFEEDSEGYVYANSSDGLGLLSINDDNVSVIHSSANYKFFRTTSGNVYYCCTTNYNTGVFLINKGVKTNVYGVEYNWSFIEDNEQNLYAYATVTSCSGVVILNTEPAKKIYQSGTNWSVFKTNNSLYVYDKKTNEFMHLTNDIATKIYTGGYIWSYINAHNEGIILSKTFNPSSDDFLFIDNSSNTAYLVRGK